MSHSVNMEDRKHSVCLWRPLVLKQNFVSLEAAMTITASRIDGFLYFVCKDIQNTAIIPPAIFKMCQVLLAHPVYFQKSM